MTSATTEPVRGRDGSLTIIALDVVALWGLCAYGSRANLETA
jgi:hypothetical protein